MWAIGVPAQLCSPDLGAELAGACALTSLVVGHDFVPRASLAARYAVAAQAMVGLARLRGGAGGCGGGGFGGVGTESVCCTDSIGSETADAAAAALRTDLRTAAPHRRYSKTGLQLALLFEGIFPKRFKGRWLNPGRALRPLGDIPAEALRYLER